MTYTPTDAEIEALAKLGVKQSSEIPKKSYARALSFAQNAKKPA